LCVFDLQANLEGDSLNLFHHTWTHLLAGLPSELEVRFLYLQTPVKIAQNRIAERGREAEQKIPKEYMQSLHDNHEAWVKLPEMQDRHHTIDTAIGIDSVRETAIDQICAWIEEAGNIYIEKRDTIKESQWLNVRYTAMFSATKRINDTLKPPSKRIESAEVS
jgi:deoxyadenosine/deoxycytidine kinase